MSTSYPSLGKYQIIEEIGRGGMGAVYKAYDLFLDRTVAIKLLAPHLLWEPGFVERFLREARAAGRLQHPNIIPVYDVGQEGNNYYFVMACLPGPSLKQMISQKGKLPPAEALPILRQVADALDYAHDKGLVHRDVKPANVMFGERGQAVLMDLGIVKAVEESRLTGTGASVGTPHYMAPEQVKGAEVDARADQYALAILAFEMLTGNVPFDAATTTAVLFKQVNDPPPSICKLCPDLPRAVDGVIKRALNKSPDKRYASCGEFVKALEPALVQAVAKPRKPRAEPERTPTPRPVEPPPTQVILAKARPFIPFSAGSWQELLFIGAGIGVLVIVGLVIAALASRPGPATPTPVVAVAPTSSATPAPTSTLQKTPTPTNTPSPPTQTPTPVPTLRASTPVPQPAAVIASNNVNRLAVLAEWNDAGHFVAFSPDSKLLASGGNVVSLWDVSSGRQVRVLSGFTGGVTSLAFSPDGAMLAANLTGPDGTVRLWEVSSGHGLHIFPGGSYGGNSVAFSPDGKRLASIGSGSIRQWDVSSGNRLAVIEVSENLQSVTFSPDGRLLASAAETVQLWETSTGRQVRTLAADGPAFVAFSPDSKLLATGWQLWEVASGRELRAFNPGERIVRLGSVAFSPDGKLLAWGTFNPKLFLWDVASGRLVHTLPDTSEVVCVAFSPDGKLLASGTGDGTVRVWGIR